MQDLSAREPLRTAPGSAAPARGRCVLVISGVWPTRRNPISGIFLVQQVRALSRLGLFVQVIVVRAPWSAPVLAPADLQLDEAAVRVVATTVWPVPARLSGSSIAIRFNVASHSRAIQRALAHVLPELPAVAGVIVHDLRYCGLSIPAWRRMIRARLALVLHGEDPFLDRPEVQGDVRALAEPTASSADAVLLVGNRLKDYAERVGLPPSRLEVVPNGTDLPALRPRQPAPSRSTTFISVSNLTRTKGIDDNLLALAQILEEGYRDWRYVVIGDGPERRRLQDLAAQKSLAGHVDFLGRLDYAHTMEKLAEADVFALPSWNEAFGIVYLEAMARRVPPIGCHGNGAADIITAGEDGLLIPPREIGALKEAMLRLMNDRALRERMGARARRTAERYSWQRNARRMAEILGLDPVEAATG